MLFRSVVIGENAKIVYSIIDEGAYIGKNASVGKEKNVSSGITVIGAGISVPDGMVVEDDKMVSCVADLTKKEEA